MILTLTSEKSLKLAFTDVTLDNAAMEFDVTQPLKPDTDTYASLMGRVVYLTAQISYDHVVSQIIQEDEDDADVSVEGELIKKLKEQEAALELSIKKKLEPTMRERLVRVREMIKDNPIYDSDVIPGASISISEYHSGVQVDIFSKIFKVGCGYIITDEKGVLDYQRLLHKDRFKSSWEFRPVNIRRALSALELAESAMLLPKDVKTSSPDQDPAASTQPASQASPDLA